MIHLAATLSALLLCVSAHAGSSCTLLADSTGRVLLEEGRCDSATTPASTFKLPLALMGADAGYLKGAHSPSIAYRDSFAASLPSHREAADPTRWMTESVVWYSQEMTLSMGMERFGAYVERFGYGNRNLSGDRGRGNGLTNAWLSSSLEIAPRGQIAFLAKVRAKSLGVAPRAYVLLDSVVTRFPGPEGWTVAGKTGSGFPKDSTGAPIAGHSVGWFVGWLERDGKTPLLFVRREIDLAPPGSYGGPHARQALLKGLPTWLAKVDSARQR
jgi:beta-lactamase class D